MKITRSLVSPTGEVLVNPKRVPHLHRALTRGVELWRKGREEWARLEELRKTGHFHEADRLQRRLLGVKSDPMPDDVKAELRARQAAMTPEEKKAAVDARRAQRLLRRLAARATGRAIGTVLGKETAVAKTKKSKAPKSVKPTRKASAPAKSERDPRLPAAGTPITREYLGKQYEVQVGETDFEYAGEKFQSLTAVAKKITGAPSINGFLFFGLTKNAPAVAKA